MLSVIDWGRGVAGVGTGLDGIEQAIACTWSGLCKMFCVDSWKANDELGSPGGEMRLEGVFVK